MSDNALGDFLRSRRDLLSPDEAGLQTGYAARRVPGLRRSEVAALAGLSTDYYMRLEQGRERRPSDQVLAALARVMHLEPDAVRYLHRLAQPPLLHRTAAEPPDSGATTLLDHLQDVPACLVGVALDILAINPLGRALYAGFADTSNLVEMVFLDPYAHTFWLDWDDIATGCVHSLRASAAEFPDDDRIPALVARIRDTNPAFGRRWDDHRLVERTRERKRYCHPQAGEFELEFESLSISGSPGQHIYVYLPVAGDDGIERLAATN